MCIKAKSAAKWNAGTAGCTRKGQNRRLRLTVYSHELDRIFGACVQADNGRALQPPCGGTSICAPLPPGRTTRLRLLKSSRKSKPSPTARTKLLDLALCGGALQRRVQAAQRTCNGHCRPRAAANRTTERRQDTGRTYPTGGKPAPHHRKERWQMSCGFSREMSKALVDHIIVDSDGAKPVSRSIFSSPPVQSRSYLRRKPLTHSCK